MHLKRMICGKNYKVLKCLLGILVFVIIIYIVVSRLEEDPESYEEYQMVLDRCNQFGGHCKGVKTILYWSVMYRERFRHMLFGSGDVFKHCDIPHCYATPNRRLLNSVSDYDAIMFSGIEINQYDLPHVRSSHQRYVYFSREPALARPLNDFEFMLRPNFYNWTMAYRLDSDIIRPYAVIRDTVTNAVVFPPKNDHDIVQWRQPGEMIYDSTSEALPVIKGKSKMAAWFVSHCGSLSYRDHLAEELQKHLLVDIYGDCGTLECTKNTDECYDMVEKDYFFYLAFENSLCKDYITEKVYFPMSKYVIPIVYGGGNYTKFLPPHSYINVYDFKSIKDLADFMIELANNPYEYASYFWWEKYYRIEDPTKFTLCNMCAMLHNSSSPKTSLKNFQDYYITDQCQTLELDGADTVDDIIFGPQKPYNRML